MRSVWISGRTWPLESRAKCSWPRTMVERGADPVEGGGEARAELELSAVARVREGDAGEGGNPSAKRSPQIAAQRVLAARLCTVRHRPLDRRAQPTPTYMRLYPRHLPHVSQLNVFLISEVATDSRFLSQSVALNLVVSHRAGAGVHGPPTQRRVRKLAVSSFAGSPRVYPNMQNVGTV